MLAKTVKIYDPLGLVSPVTLQAKLLFRDCCDVKLSWDKELPQQLKDIPRSVKIARSIVGFQEIITEIELHTFADACSYGVGAIVVAIVHHVSGTNKGLVASNPRLAKKDLTIPRL